MYRPGRVDYGKQKKSASTGCVYAHKTGQVSVGADSKPRFVAAAKLNKSANQEGVSYSNNSYAENYLKVS